MLIDSQAEGPLAPERTSEIRFASHVTKYGPRRAALHEN